MIASKQFNLAIRCESRQIGPKQYRHRVLAIKQSACVLVPTLI